MTAENLVTLTGNVTRDPELRFTPGGKAVAGFGIAFNPRRYDAEQGKYVDGDVSFFDVAVWSKLAEHVAESVTKGQRVTIVGRLRQRSWETDQGEKRSKVEVVADEVSVSLRFGTVEFTKDESGGGGGGGGQYLPPPDDEEPF